MPGIEKIGEAIVDDTRDLADHRQSDQPAEPGVAGRP
jgi:hypothetical protein